MNLDRAAVGMPGFEFTLLDERGKPRTLSEFTATGPVLLAFYPGDFTPVCTKQLCNYRDNFADFEKLGVQIVGISANSVEEHFKFATTYDFKFPLLSDPKKETAKAYGCTSLILLGGVSRAIVIVGKTGKIVHRYVESTPLTHRKSEELVAVLSELRLKGAL
jgi:peroxiredoxin Q/BCP